MEPVCGSEDPLTGVLQNLFRGQIGVRLNLFFGVRQNSESVSTGVWCVLGFGAGSEIALEPSKLQK